uniref:Uncharacterized protein n=1 Tax=Parascaris equorum TaxID=6256 RepID=A0A914RTX2_PAREQ
MGLSGMLITGTIGAGALAITLASVPFVAPGLRRVCLPYVPATVRQLRHIADALSPLIAINFMPLTLCCANFFTNLCKPRFCVASLTKINRRYQFIGMI